MFNVGTGELLVILLVALIVLGPEKLPDAARKIGNVVGELRRMSQGFQNEIRSAMDTASTTEQPTSPSSPRLEPVPDEARPAAESKPDDPAA